MEERIYLDYAATTFPKPECVYQQMDRALRWLSFNAGRGSYGRSVNAVEILELLRKELLELVNGTGTMDVVLCPSATIALNQIIGGLNLDSQAVVYITPFEHNAVVRPLHMMYPEVKLRILPQKTYSHEIDIKQMEYEFAKNPPTHVFLTHISNVTGYVLPVEDILPIVKKYHGTTVVDGSQSLGLLHLDMEKSPIDYLVFAGHKNMYGPFGIGGFFLRKGLELKPYLAGGTGSDSENLKMPLHGPSRYEPGSPNISGAAGLLAALYYLKSISGQSYLRGTKYFREKAYSLTKITAEKLSRIPRVKLYLPPEHAHIGIVSFCVKGYQSKDVGTILDEEYQIEVRTGYHCAPLVHKILHTKPYGGTVRVSVGRATTREEIEALGEAVRGL